MQTVLALWQLLATLCCPRLLHLDSICVQDLSFYAFPTLENLREATDEALRAEGFGYRCTCATPLLQ